MEATPDPGSFPQRNAIIAGLSLATLVVEAGPRSGTRITVDHALEANRTVYAVPGDITRVNSIGTNQLIKEGARLVTCAEDIVRDLHPALSQVLTELPEPALDAQPAAPPPLPDDLTPVEAALFEALETDPLDIDALNESLENHDGPGQILSALLNLELRGLVRQEPGKRFRRLR